MQVHPRSHARVCSHGRKHTCASARAQTHYMHLQMCTHTGGAVSSKAAGADEGGGKRSKTSHADAAAAGGDGGGEEGFQVSLFRPPFEEFEVREIMK